MEGTVSLAPAAAPPPEGPPPPTLPPGEDRDMESELGEFPAAGEGLLGEGFITEEDPPIEVEFELE